MKRKFVLFITILFASYWSSEGQTQMVTFQVENPATTPVYVFGSWNWNGWPGIPMNLVAPNKYSATITLPSNATHEYLFVNGSTPVKETLNPAWTCTNGNAQYTNRVLSLGSADTAVCYTWATCNTCTITPPPPPPTPVNVTFQVESPDSTPVYLIGSWNWTIFPGAAMSLIAPNKYSVTMSLLPNLPYEFLFVNGTQTKEVLNPTWTCTNGNSQYTNRVLNLGGSDTGVCYTWETCNTCTVTPPPSNVNVTLQVENPDSTPVYVIGSWDWTNFPGILMNSIGGNKYEAVVSLPANSTAEYLFVNGTVTKEVLNPAWSCTNGNTQFTNRILSIGTTAFTKCNKWELCDSCGATVPSNINVTFGVQSPDSTLVYVIGSWNWTNFPGTPMVLNSSTGNYEVTIPLSSVSNIEYLFVNGQSTKEVLDPTWPCTNGNTQFTNRVASLGITDTAICYVWETCGTCQPLSISDIKDEDLNLFAGSQFIRINSSVSSDINQLDIFDIVGRKIYSSNQKYKTNENIGIELTENSLNVIRIKIGNKYYSFKTIIKK